MRTYSIIRMAVRKFLHISLAVVVGSLCSWASSLDFHFRGSVTDIYYAFGAPTSPIEVGSTVELEVHLTGGESCMPNGPACDYSGSGSEQLRIRSRLSSYEFRTFPGTVFQILVGDNAPVNDVSGPPGDYIQVGEVSVTVPSNWPESATTSGASHRFIAWDETVPWNMLINSAFPPLINWAQEDFAGGNLVFSSETAAGREVAIIVTYKLHTAEIPEPGACVLVTLGFMGLMLPSNAPLCRVWPSRFRRRTQ